MYSEAMERRKGSPRERELERETEFVKKDIERLRTDFYEGRITYDELVLNIRNDLRYVTLLNEIKQTVYGHLDLKTGQWVPETRNQFLLRTAKKYAKGFLIVGALAGAAHYTYDLRDKVYEKYNIPLTVNDVNTAFGDYGWNDVSGYFTSLYSSLITGTQPSVSAAETLTPSSTSPNP